MSSTFDVEARKSGNSIVITIPKATRELRGIIDGTKITVTIHKVDNKMEDE